MIAADVVMVVLSAVLLVLVVARHRSYHVDQAHLDHLRDDYRIRR